jgi:hypothetical protein
MNLGNAINDVYDNEARVAQELYRLGARHAADADIAQLSHTLAGRCGPKLQALAVAAARYETAPPPPISPPAPAVQTVRRAGGHALAHSSSSAVHLLGDLSRLYPIAHRAEIAWVILQQGARASRDTDLTEAAGNGQHEAQTRIQWLRTRIKETAPQILAG